MDASLVKLLWVAAPLLAALAALAWWALRRQLPTRHGLNVGFSLLLLAYVLTTAGLGIFWVANQQLPVFDWHYLFGYATVLLLIVHLAFNLRTVWHHLRRKAGVAPQRPPSQSTPASSGISRRPWLGAAGLGTVALAAGLGYLLGIRHGRTEFKLADLGDGTSPGPPLHTAPGAEVSSSGPAALAWAVVQQFHAFSGHSRRRVLRHAASSDWGLAPPPFKRYAGVPRIQLPRLRAALAAGAGPAVRPGPPHDDRSRDLGDLGDLGEILWHTAGISARRGGIAFRTSPSSGALFATELYVLALALPGLEPGPWHYDPEHHALHRLIESVPATALSALVQEQVQEQVGPLPRPAGCRALIVASAIFARSGHKYGDRTYRYVLADLGHALENLRVAARDLGAGAVQLLSHFDDAAIGRALALDARLEGVLAVAALGPALAAPAAVPDRASWVSGLGGDASAGLPATLGLTEAMHAATSLRQIGARGSTAGTAAPPPAAFTAPRAPAAAPAATVQRLPPASHLRLDGLRLIAQRRSIRRFTAGAVSQQSLADILAAMTAPPALLSPAVRIDLVTAAAQGLPQAAWRVQARDGAVQLQQRVLHGNALRERARAAALDQDVIGDAAVVFVLSLDIAALRGDAFGAARGYRHAFIEAGLVGERLYLAAGALGLGVCAVGAFYDDEAAALVGLDATQEWPVHFAALGVAG